MEPNIITKFLFRKRVIEDTKVKLSYLSEDTYISINFFLIMRFISSIALFFVILYTNELGVIFAPIISFLYYVVIDNVILDGVIKREAERLEREAIYFFEVLMVTLSAGTSFKVALEKTSSSIPGSLSLKFNRALLELNYGKMLYESLNEMAKSIPSKDVRKIIVALAEAEMLGVSINDTLDLQLAFLENAFIMKKRKEILQIPAKIGVVSVLFFVPIIITLLIAPFLIKIL